MLTSIALAFVAPASLAQRIDEYIAPYAARRDFSGVILVRQNGKQVYAKSSGLASFEWNVKHTPASVFCVASLTKTFTAGAIYLLEKKGKLSFTDKLSRFLPAFPKADSILIHHMLGHTSGVGEPDMTALQHQTPSLDEVIAKIAAEPSQFDPGTKSSYSNSGYTILAKVIEVASGKSFDQFLQDEFFGPLGMKSTGNYVQSDLVPNRALPYVPGPPPSQVIPVPGYDQTPYLGAGSLWSTADDLAKWLGAVGRNQFFEIDKLSWPMGWGKRTYFGKRANEQTGLADGFASGMISFPAEKLEVVVLSNVQTQFALRSVIDIAGIALGEKPVVLPEPKFCSAETVDGSTVLGKFQMENGPTMEIVHRKGSYYYHWGDDANYKYLSPVSANSLYARDEFATWEWTSSNGFVWSGPYGKLNLKRVK